MYSSKDFFASGKSENDSATEEISATASDDKIVKTDVVIAKTDIKKPKLSDYFGCWWKRGSTKEDKCLPNKQKNMQKRV